MKSSAKRSITREEFCLEESRFSDAQIVSAIKQHEIGVPVAEICRKMGISDGIRSTFYMREKKYGGLAPPELKKLRQLEEDLKQLIL